MMRHFVIAIVLLSACREREGAIISEAGQHSLRYAKGFRITTENGFKKVEVMYPYQGAPSGYTYLLVPEGQTAPETAKGVRIIRTPVERIVCTSTTHIPMLDYLGATEKLVGFPTTDYISSEKMRQRVDEGKVAELGVDKAMDVEKLVYLQPDFVMGYLMSADYGQFRKIEDLGIPVVINSEYLERHPLGRAEWIKFMGLLLGKEAMADSIFQVIEKNYLAVRERAKASTDRPAVMSGIIYGDSWFLPGGRNNGSQILRDAGCEYLWSSDSSHGFLQLGFEHVYQTAHDADLWIGTGNFNTLRDLANADHRYERFRAFREKKVYTYDGRKGAKGGSEFLELGYLRPDIVLQDLVKIAHPELLPDYELYFHRKLE